MASRPSLEGVRDSGLGPLIRMRALRVEQLPAHPDLASQQTAAPDIHSFVSSALEEGNAFMTTYLPHHFTVKSENRQSPPSTAPVKLFAHDINASDLPAEVREADAGAEAWFARTSIHQNEAKDGTASWEEFDKGLRVNHSQNEMDYTPTVIDAHEVMNWDSQLETVERKVGKWEDVHVSIMEMRHELPTPLNNRVFPVLLITAKRNLEIIDVQIPVATRGLPNAKFHNVPKVTGGMYCSIERGELIEDGTKVQWDMATASDAKGVLPMWAQKMGVPGAIAKDVGFFIDWCAKRRKA